MFSWLMFFKVLSIMLGVVTTATGIIGILFSDRFIRHRVIVTVIFAICTAIGIAVFSAGVAIRL